MSLANGRMSLSEMIRLGKQTQKTKIFVKYLFLIETRLNFLKIFSQTSALRFFKFVGL